MWKNAAKIIGAIVLVGSLASTIIFAGSYFVHAEDYRRDQQSFADAIRQNEWSRLDDEVYRLERIPAAQRTLDDQAWIERYKRKMKQLEQPKP